MPTPVSRRTVRWLLPLALAAAAPGCGLFFEPTPDVAAAQVYDANGLRFDYPGNWKHEAEVTATDGIETVLVTVESTGSAIAMVQQFKPAIAIDPDEMLGVLTTEMRKAAGEQLAGALDYAQGGTRSATRTMLGGERPVRASSFEVALVGQKVPHTFEVIVAELDDRSIMVFTQAPDEDLATARPGFDQIVGSLTAR